MQRHFEKPIYINCNGKLLHLTTPKIMGIINITPDSFYADSRLMGTSSVLNKVREMVHQGADIIDIGAYSSRPGAEHISLELEWKRLEPVLYLLRSEFPELIISLDTFRASIAKNAIEKYKVDLINDISAGELDHEMFETIAGLKIPYILMHMVGNPQNMLQNTQYSNVMNSIFNYFTTKIEKLKILGVSDIIIDPGFGFSKTLEQNFQLLSKLEEFQIFEKQILVGLSRKSMIYKLLQTSPELALNGTTVLNTIALQKGASILRVHDVKPAKECVQLFLKSQQDSFF